MRLSDFLTPSRIIVPLADDTLDGARRALLDRLVASGAIDDLERLQGRVAEERGEDMVAIGGQAFLLHYRTDTASALQVALGVAPDGVRRGADESDMRAPVVVVVVGPPRLAARQLQVVRAFGRLLIRREAIDAITAAASPEAIATLDVFRDHEIPEQLLVRDIMTERPRTTRADVPLRQAAVELVRSGLAALPVVDDDQHFLGMLSERELMRHLLATEVLSAGGGGAHGPASPQPSKKSVRDAMTRQVMCVGPEQPVAEVAALMTNKDVERVPVVREGRLVGFLTRGDIVRKLIGS